MLKELSQQTTNLEIYYTKLGTREDNKALKKRLKEEWDSSIPLVKDLIASVNSKTDRELTEALDKEMNRYQGVRKKIEKKRTSNY